MSEIKGKDGKRLGVSGTVKIPEGKGAVTWSVTSTFTVTKDKGTNVIKVVGTAGEYTVTDLKKLSKIDLSTVMKDGKSSHYRLDASQFWGKGKRRRELGGYLMGIHNPASRSYLLGGGLNLSLGTKKVGRHEIGFLYQAMQSDKFTHYAEAAYKYLKKDFSVGVGGSVTVKPGDTGYDALWNLQAKVGLKPAKGHTLTFKVGMSSDGKKVAYTAGAEWDWKGALNVKLDASYSALPDAPDAYKALLTVTPGGKKGPLSLFMGLNQNMGPESLLQHEKQFGPQNTLNLGLKLHFP